MISSLLEQPAFVKYWIYFEISRRSQRQIINFHRTNSLVSLVYDYHWFLRSSWTCQSLLSERRRCLFPLDSFLQSTLYFRVLYLNADSQCCANPTTEKPITSWIIFYTIYNPRCTTSLKSTFSFLFEMTSFRLQW